MKRIIVFALSIATFVFALTISGEMIFDRTRLGLNERDGMTVVSLERLTSTWEVGVPSLPIAIAQLVAPPNMRAMDVTVQELESETLGTYEIYPVQPAIAVSDTDPPGYYVPPDAKYYNQTYPGNVVTTGHQGSMFGYNIASVFVAPVQYNGINKLLVLHSRVRFTITFEPSDLGYLHPGNRSVEARGRIESLLSRLVLNPEDLSRWAP
jgi:Propeptide_C25